MCSCVNVHQYCNTVGLLLCDQKLFYALWHEVATLILHDWGAPYTGSPFVLPMCFEKIDNNDEK